jgi:hypothetical protein
MQEEEGRVGGFGDHVEDLGTMSMHIRLYSHN